MKHARGDYNRIQDPSGKIPDNEPVFLLRGQDVIAPLVVELWADIAEYHGADPELVHAAQKQAEAMREWQGSVKSKIPDM